MLINRRSTAAIDRGRAGSPRTLSVGDGKIGPYDMVWTPESNFLMGTENRMAMPNERPAHTVHVSSFWMDRHDATNAQFEPFVEATNYVTTAEQRPRWAVLKVQLPPGISEPPPETMVTGAMASVGTDQAVSLNNYSQLWRYVPGASQHHRKGPGSNLEGKREISGGPGVLRGCQGFRAMDGERLQTEAECPSRSGPDEHHIAIGFFRATTPGQWMAKRPVQKRNVGMKAQASSRYQEQRQLVAHDQAENINVNKAQ